MSCAHKDASGLLPSEGTWGVMGGDLMWAQMRVIFAAGGTTFVLLPHARRFTEAIGLLPTSGGAGSRAKMPPPPLSKSAPPLLLAYLLLIGAGVAASSLATASAPWHVERLGKLTPPHRWGVEVARCEGTKA